MVVFWLYDSKLAKFIVFLHNMIIVRCILELHSRLYLNYNFWLSQNYTGIFHKRNVWLEDTDKTDCNFLLIIYNHAYGA